MSEIVDPAFKAIPKNSTFFLIWRIEKLQVVPVPKDNYGFFYTGDSYIVACATDGKERVDSQCKPRETKPEMLDIRIHFWLGSNTSQDEAGVAAYKTVELDNYFNGTPVQHREVQEHESSRFISYFRCGVRYMEGGVASGFNHVERVAKNRLFHVKGKRIPIVKECPTIGWDVMNSGDVFILDALPHVFLWSGSRANYMEKIQAAKIAQQFKGEHGPECSSIVIVEDGEEGKMKSKELEVWEELLPLGSKSLGKETSDAEVEKKRRTQIKLYQCTDDSGTLKVVELKDGPLQQSDLNSADSFIVDNGENGIWAWIGKKASQKERLEAMRNAQGFIKKKGYPDHTQITRVIDGGEPLDFKSLFHDWKDTGLVTGLGKTYSAGGRVAKIKDLPQKKFDPCILHQNRSLAAEIQMVDDGRGKKTVYRIKSFDLVPVEENDHGNFFSGDCYIIVYKYEVNNRENVNIYFWIGSTCSIDERGVAAIKAVEIDDKEFAGKAVQIRVVEGKEPPQFTAMFGGNMVIYKGGFKSGFRSVRHQASSGGDQHGDTYLLEVRGTTPYVTRAKEVECVAGSLNSNDCFLLFTPTTVHVWMGKGSTGDEREMAKNLASKSEGREIILISEGQEKGDFWKAIGGQGDYVQEKNPSKLSTNQHPVRLYQCSNASGVFTVEEIADYQQTDLIQEDVMLLDAWDTLFLWIGSKSNVEERNKALEVAEEYLRSDPSGRDLETPVVQIKQTNEPINFTGFFGSWDGDIWGDLSFEKVKMEISSGGGDATSSGSKIAGNVSGDAKYPIEVLRIKNPMQLPDNVDPTKKETYLTSEDFQKVFGMDFSQYLALQKWKQVDLKKKVGLF